MDRPRISFKTYFYRPSAWLMVVFFIFAAIAAPFTYIENRNAALLERDGVETQGIVTDRERETRRNNNGGQRVRYILTVSYQATDGATYTDRREVTITEYNRIANGQAQPVRYSASRPDVAEAVAGETRRIATVMALVTAALLAVALISLWILLRGIGSQRRAATIGERRMARVLAHHVVGKPRYKTFAVEWNDGQHSERTSTIKEAKLPPIGSDIAVYLDPKTGKGWWEGEY